MLSDKVKQDLWLDIEISKIWAPFSLKDLDDKILFTNGTLPGM